MAWIKAEKDTYLADAVFNQEMKLLPELMRELDVEDEWTLDDM